MAHLPQRSKCLARLKQYSLATEPARRAMHDQSEQSDNMNPVSKAFYNFARIVI